MTSTDLINKQGDYQIPEIFKRHIGVWQGTAIKVSSKGELERTFHGTFAVSIEGSDYYQENTYTLADGNTRKLRFKGHFENGFLILSSSDYPEFSGKAWDGGEETIMFRSSKIENGKHYIYVETMTLTNSNTRVRSSQIFQDGVFNGISYIEETRQEKVI
ncbi:MAG: hypothetical protein QNJ33_07370 [Crocosphaera sp.]|nr:hypothetical protein [Crocosphaera sp.]